MLPKFRKQHPEVAAVGRQFTYLSQKHGSIEAALTELKNIGQQGQQHIISRFEKIFGESPDESAALGWRMGPYTMLQRLIAIVKEEQGDSIALLSQFNKAVLNIDEQINALWVSIGSFLLYMAFVLLIALSVISMLMIFVIPQFQAMFESFGARLPGLTYFVSQYNGIIFLSILSGFVFTVFALLTSLHHIFDTISELSPIDTGKIRFAPFMNRLARTYNRWLAMSYAGLFLSAGLPDERALVLSAELTKDTALNAAATNRSEQTPGGTLAAALSLAKEAGNLAAELEHHISEQSYQLAADVTRARQETLFLMHLILAIIVGTLVIAMYLPLFKMGEVG